MATITYKEIEQVLHKVAPAMLDWNPTDQDYVLVDPDEIPGLLEQFPAKPWKENKWECEEIARGFLHDIRSWEADRDDVTHNRAVGVAFCSRVGGQEMRHTINVIITPAGPVMADLQTGHYHFAEEGKDEIYFIEM